MRFISSLLFVGAVGGAVATAGCAHLRTEGDAAGRTSDEAAADAARPLPASLRGAVVLAGADGAELRMTPADTRHLPRDLAAVSSSGFISVPVQGRFRVETNANTPDYVERPEMMRTPISLQSVRSLRDGMPAADVRARLGEPIEVQRERAVERWTYDSFTPSVAYRMQLVVVLNAGRLTGFPNVPAEYLSEDVLVSNQNAGADGLTVPPAAK